NQNVVSIAAQTVMPGDFPLMLILFTDTAGRLWQTTMVMAGPNPTFSQPTQIATTHTPSEEISMTGGGDHAWLAFKDASGAIWLKKWTGGLWSAETQAQQSLRQFPAVPSSTSPAIYEAPDGTLYGAFPQAPLAGLHDLRLWTRNATSGLWSDTGYLSVSG